MKFREIVEILSNQNDIHLISDSGEAEITGVRLWDPGSRDGDPAVLYFSYDSQIEDVPAHCVIAMPADPQAQVEREAAFRSREDLSVAWVPAGEFGSAFNAAQEVVRGVSRKGFYDYMMEIANRVRSVDTLIDIAAQSFGASLICIDRNYRILSYSTQVPVVDRLWVENIRRGYCDYEFITEVRKLKAVQMADSSSTPLEVSCKSSPFRKLASRVYCRDAWVGSILLIEGEDSYRPEHPDMLRVLSGVVGYTILAHSPELLYRTNEYHSFLYNLLIGAPLETQPEVYRKLKFPERMQLIYFKSGRDGAVFPQEAVLEERFRKILPSCHILSHREGAVLLCKAGILPEESQLLEPFPESLEVYAGVSDVFHDVSRLRDALKEAREAITAGRMLDPGQRFYSFEKYGIYILLRNAGERENLRRYCHSAISVLQNYDRKNHARLMETLEIYLNTNCSIKDTSEALFLHRNSVIYRLQKIEELGGIDLADVGTGFRLRLSFAILRMLGTEEAL